MTDHAHELRRYARKIAHPAGDVPAVMLAAADEIERLQAKAEAAEKSDAESIAMYRKARDERDALRAALQHEADCVESAKSEIEALRAKITEMEKQEPVAWTTQLALELGSSALGFDACRGNLWGDKGVPLYALPGAKGEEK